MNLTKYLTIIIIVLNFCSCSDDEVQTFESNCLPQSLQNGVISFYPFTNGSLNDFSNFDNRLSIGNSTQSTKDRGGNNDCAYIFQNLEDENNYLVNKNPEDWNNLNSFSISLWYAPVKTSRSEDIYEVLLGRGEFISRCPDRRGEWSLGLYDSKSAVFGHDNSVWGGSDKESYPDFANDEMDNWHHVVSVKDGNNYYIYKDGLLFDFDEGGANCSNSYNALDEGDIYVGRYFTGKIDDIIVYNRGLSEEEVVSLFELDTCCSE